MALSASQVHEEPLPPGKQFRNQLAAAVRNINWSYAIFWSISTTRPGVLTWKDGFYNGEIKTRKISNSPDLSAEQLVLQRSVQLRELYNSLLSGDCDHRSRRPAASLSPEDLGDTEWYYMVCMTYAFRSGQGLPGKSFASNEYVWLCNAHFADSKTFPRALLAKNASIQTLLCIPFMGGVLEFGTTDPVSEDPDYVTRIKTSFWELQLPAARSEWEEPISSPSANDTGEADVVPENHNAFEAVVSGAHELGEVECLSDTNLERITKEIDEFYSLCDEMVMPSLEDNWLIDASFELPSSPEAAAMAADDGVTMNGSLEGPQSSCFTAWKRTSDSGDAAVPITGESQKLLKKAVAGGAWTSNADGSTASAQENTIKNHVMSERRRREKLNEMFLILRSLVPSIHKVDKASILAETIAYLKELEQRVQELESTMEPTEITGRRRHDVARKKVSGAKRKTPEHGGGGVEKEHNWTLSTKDCPNNVNVSVVDKEVLLEVQCRWKELLMTRVFDAIKSLHLDVLSVQASTPDSLLALKIRAQFAGTATVPPGMIIEALHKAVGKR